MSDRVLWNYYDVAKIEDGGWVVLQRRCTGVASPATIASHNGSVILHAYREQELPARDEAKRRNDALGDEYVPHPFER